MISTATATPRRGPTAALFLLAIPCIVSCSTTSSTDADSFDLQSRMHCLNRTGLYAGPFTMRNLSGQITSHGAPLQGAQILVKSSRTKKVSGQVSDETGSFKFPPVISDTFLVRICKTGWSYAEFTVTVSPESRGALPSIAIDLPAEK